MVGIGQVALQLIHCTLQYFHIQVVGRLSARLALRALRCVCLRERECGLCSFVREHSRGRVEHSLYDIYKLHQVTTVSIIIYKYFLAIFYCNISPLLLSTLFKLNIHKITINYARKYLWMSGMEGLIALGSTFESFGLDRRIRKAVEKKGFAHPTLVLFSLIHIYFTFFILSHF